MLRGKEVTSRRPLPIEEDSPLEEEEEEGNTCSIITRCPSPPSLMIKISPRATDGVLSPVQVC